MTTTPARPTICSRTNDVNQMINQLLRMFANQMVNRGINKSIDTASGANSKLKTPAERRQAQATAKRARQTVGILRRFLR